MASEKNTVSESKILKEPGIHDGHRDRMRKRFEQTGLEGFAPHEALELLLYYCIPRRDTNEIAHKLLAKFDNSISKVFEAPIEELMQVEYISYNAAILIKMITALSRMYVADKIAPREKITSADDAKAYFLSKFFAREAEMFMMLYLDNGSKIINCDVINEGSVNSSGVDMNKIISAALSKRASACIAAHNHPRGLPFPSSDDVESTEKIMAALKGIHVELLDHIIVGSEDREVMSMAESYRFQHLFHKKY